MRDQLMKETAMLAAAELVRQLSAAQKLIDAGVLTEDQFAACHQSCVNEGLSTMGFADRFAQLVLSKTGPANDEGPNGNDLAA